MSRTIDLKKLSDEDKRYLVHRGEVPAGVEISQAARFKLLGADPDRGGSSGSGGNVSTEATARSGRAPGDAAPGEDYEDMSKAELVATAADPDRGGSSGSGGNVSTEATARSGRAPGDAAPGEDYEDMSKAELVATAADPDRGGSSGSGGNVSTEATARSGRAPGDAAPGEDYEDMSKAELVATAEERGLDTGGTKADIIARLEEDDS